MNIKLPRFTLRRFRLASACAGLALLTACDPADVISWAPDGQHAIVQGKTGEFLVDPAGKILGEARGVQVWMPDSQHAIGVLHLEARDWAEYASLLGADRTAEIVNAAEQLLPMIQKYAGDWDKFDGDPAVQSWATAHSATKLPDAVYYLLQTHAEAMAAPIARWRQESKDQTPVTATIYELILRDALSKEPHAGQVLLRSADAITGLLPSPQGKAIAFVRSLPDSARLEIMSREGGEPQLVADGPEQAAWSPDGQQLVYARPGNAAKSHQADLTLGTITRRRICDGGGAILAKLEDAEDLAGIVYLTGQSRVACLPDGRILFASLIVHLPALNKDMPKDVALFALRPGETPALERIISEETQKKLPNRIDQFVLSPDGRKLAIPGEKGEVAVLALDTGEVTTFQEKGWDFNDNNIFANHERPSPAAPSWRTAEELCYVSAMPDRNGQPARAEMVLRKLGGAPHPISESWSDAETDAFLPLLKPAAPPAPPEAASPASSGAK